LFEHTRKLREQRLLRTPTTEFKKGRDSLLLVGKRGSTGREHFISPSSLSDSESDEPPHRRSTGFLDIEDSLGGEQYDSIPRRENEESMRDEEHSVPEQKTDFIIKELLKEYTTLGAEISEAT